jgi:hypothetical protein
VIINDALIMRTFKDRLVADFKVPLFLSRYYEDSLLVPHNRFSLTIRQYHWQLGLSPYYNQSLLL